MYEESNVIHRIKSEVDKPANFKNPKYFYAFPKGSVPFPLKETYADPLDSVDCLLRYYRRGGMPPPDYDRDLREK